MLTETDGAPQPMELSPPEKLNDLHDVTQFDCGEPSINEYLHKTARKAQQQKHAVVYVSCFAGTRVVAAYYTLSNGSVAREHVPKSLQRNSPSQHPVTILGCMGVTRDAQGSGYSIDLLQDAISRSIQASQVVGSSAIIVHPLTDRLAEFYEKHAGFRPCPEISPLTMVLSLR